MHISNGLGDLWRVALLREARARALIACVGIALLATGCVTSRQSTAKGDAPDSVTVRVLSKSWGWYEASWGRVAVDDPEWGWDSVTTRVAAWDTLVALPWRQPFFKFRIGRLFRPDSAELVVNRDRFHTPESLRRKALLDTITVTARPIEFQRIITDAGERYRLRLVAPWPEPAEGLGDTCTLAGRIVNSRSGGGVPGVWVLVLGTKLWARSAADGRFSITGVAKEGLSLALWPSYADRKVIRVAGPCDSVQLALDPGESLLGPNWGRLPNAARR